MGRRPRAYPDDCTLRAAIEAAPIYGPPASRRQALALAGETPAVHIDHALRPIATT